MTHTTNFKRILCCLLAVLMLCTCVMKPLEVQATGFEVAGLGWFIAFMFMMCGIVVNSPTPADFQDLGTSFKGFLKEKDPEYELKEWWKKFQEDMEASAAFGSNALVPGPDGPYDRTPLGLSPTLLAYIAAYAAKVAYDMVIITGKTQFAPLGWCYYGDLLLPAFPIDDAYPYMVLRYTSPNSTNYAGYEVLYSTVPLYYKSGASKPTYIVQNSARSYARKVFTK